MQFLEKMQLYYNSAAQENNCYVVGSCGFDSIPADMGTVFLEEQFGGQVNSVESYIEVKAERVYFFLPFNQVRLRIIYLSERLQTSLPL